MTNHLSMGVKCIEIMLPGRLVDNGLDELHTYLLRSSTSQRPYDLERQWIQIIHQSTIVWTSGSDKISNLLGLL